MRKVALILVAVAMLFALAACGTNDPAPVSAPEPAPAPAPEPAPAPAPEPAPAPAPAPTDGPIRVAIINNPPSESGYREANVKDMTDIFTAANGYEVQSFYDQEHDPQITAARGFIADGVDYLLISAAAETGWDAVLQDAKDAGIGIFLFDRMITTNLFDAAVVSDMHNQGKMAIEVLEGLGLPEYNIIHIQGQMGSAAQVGRTEPFMAHVGANANWNIVVQQTASWDPDTAKQIVESVIASGDSFNVVYAENDGMAAGAVAALDDAGITHGINADGSLRDVVIIGVDANRWALRELLDGNWNFNIQCSPFQAQIIHEMIQGTRSYSPGEVIINPERYFDARNITEAEIAQFGLGD